MAAGDHQRREATRPAATLVLLVAQPRLIEALLQITREDVVLFGVHREGMAPEQLGGTTWTGHRIFFICSTK